MAKRNTPQSEEEEPKSENRIITKKEVDNLHIGRQRVMDLMELHRDQMIKALPSYLPVDRIMGIAVTAMTKNPKLLQCTQVSVISSILTCCQLGLLMDGILGEAFLVPFKNNQRNTLECQVIIGYKGFNSLAHRSGMVSSTQYCAVYAANEEDGDEFDYDLGLNEKLVHKRSGLSDVSRITHFYAIVRYLNGGRSFHVMNRAEVDRVRDNSPNYKFAIKKQNTFWYKWYAQMGMKTVLLALLKLTPLSTELSQAIAIDELQSSGESQKLSLRFMGDIKVDAEDITHEVLLDQKYEEESRLEDQREVSADKSAAATENTINQINKRKTKRKLPS